MLTEAKPQLNYEAIEAWITPPQPAEFRKIPVLDGRPVNPARLFALMEVFDRGMIDRKFLLGAYQNPEIILTDPNIPISDNQVLFYSSAVFGKRFLDILKGPMSRRKFLIYAGVIGILTACSPLGNTGNDTPRETVPTEPDATSDRNCSDILPPLIDPLPPIDQAEYDLKNHHEKAAYLISGGYVNEWVQGSREDFFSRASDEAKTIIVRSFAELMAENESDLADRVRIAKTRDEFTEILSAHVFDPESIAEYARQSLGVSFTRQSDGKQETVVNLSRINELSTEVFGEDLGNAMITISDNFVHELNHFAAKPRDLTSEEKAELKKIIKEFRPDGREVSNIIDPESELNVYYQLEGESEEIGYTLFNAGGIVLNTAWAEVTREYSQQMYYKRLNLKINSHVQGSYDIISYIGFKLLDYFHKKIKIPEENIVDFLNELRSGNQHNLADLVHKYLAYAREVNPDLDGSHIIGALSYIDSFASLSQEKLDKYDWRTVNYEDTSRLTCEIYDLYKASMLLIDKTIEEARLDSRIINSQKQEAVLLSPKRTPIA